jgi:hypothetical protein
LTSLFYPWLRIFGHVSASATLSLLPNFKGYSRTTARIARCSAPITNPSCPLFSSPAYLPLCGSCPTERNSAVALARWPSKWFHLPSEFPLRRHPTQTTGRSSTASGPSSSETELPLLGRSANHLCAIISSPLIVRSYLVPCEFIEEVQQDGDVRGQQC